eukprot:5149560-Amphidinium_carterae.1
MHQAITRIQIAEYCFQQHPADHCPSHGPPLANCSNKNYHAHDKVQLLAEWAAVICAGNTRSATRPLRTPAAKASTGGVTCKPSSH